MLRGLYNAASALDAAAQNQELVAENLAHANTPGYRRHNLIYESYAQQFVGDESAGADAQTAVRSPGTYTSFEAGPIQQTGAPLDLSLSANGYFVLDGPNGPLYTRNGSFEINARGELQSKSGYRVRGQGGPILMQQGGNIVVSPEGGVFLDNVEAGRMQIARVDDPSVLNRVGPSLFSGPPPQQAPQGTVRVEQGFREGSNVQVVNEMVSMMLGYRFYDAADKALRALSDSVSMNTRPQ